MIGLLALALPAVLAMALAGLVIVVALGPSGPDGAKPDGHSDDDDGGSKTPPSAPPPPRAPTGAEPEWWPQFERDFAAYAGRDPVTAAA
jgi:hypothetical protein